MACSICNDQVKLAHPWLDQGDVPDHQFAGAFLKAGQFGIAKPA
ncbi:hypothetical protein [Erythrobacter aurantius]|nr:hypothetical protein [Erythrobacter aurantius]